MAKSLNKAILIGNLGGDPEEKILENKSILLKFRVATNKQYVVDGQVIEKTEWHNVVVYDELAKLCKKYLAKGSQVYVEGELQTTNWIKDGVKHYKTFIKAYEVLFLSKTKEKEPV
jgi:single-strand DNA-binding protein